MRFHITLIVLLLLFRLSLSDRIPLSGCGSGTAVYNADYSPSKLGSTVGACQLPAPSAEEGIGIAGVNSPFFGTSQICGTCFNITGSKGSTIVMVSDKCDSVDVCQQSDHAHFILSPEDFGKITDASSTQTAYNIGYQQVSCDHSSNIKYQMQGKPNADYMGIKFSDMDAPIRSVSLYGSSSPFTLTNGVWGWHSSGNGVDKLSFPATLLLTPGNNGGNSIQLQITSATATGWIVSTVQFSLSSSGLETCVTGTPSQYIYQNALTKGWSDVSFDTNGPVNYAFQDPDNVIQGNLASQGAIQLKFEGGFNTKYLSAIKFSIKSNSNGAVCNFYFGSKTGTAVTTTTEYTDQTLLLSSLGVDASETYMSFQNANQGSLTFNIKYIMWVFDTSIKPTPGIIDVIGKDKPGTTSGGVGSTTFTTSPTIPPGFSTSESESIDGGGKHTPASASTLHLCISFILSLQLLLLLI